MSDKAQNMASTAAVAAAAAVLPAVALDPVAAAAHRADPLRVPGSKHFATVLAFGDFEVTEHGKLVFSAPSEVPPPSGPDEPPVITCLAIQGLSGVSTDRQVAALKSGQPRVRLTRFLTHFQWDNPSVVIEQNPYKESWGELVGDSEGNIEKLLPGKATFYQYLILTVFGRPLVNVRPMIMSASGVTAWPPVGSIFSTEDSTDFYDMSAFATPAALASDEPPDQPPVATLAYCSSTVMAQVFMPSVPS